ncbi:MAG: radical SAM protein [Pseudomonadota bacterium]
MDQIVPKSRVAAPRLDRAKFTDPDVTAQGEARAHVALDRLDTLWINTGTLCNLTCAACYIESSPTNDRLVYITAQEVGSYLDEIASLGLNTREIGFTGGEPFMNPDFPDMLADALARGFEALVLTNAMQPMLRPRVMDALLALRAAHGPRLTIRVSLDHYTAELNDDERGPGAFDKAIEGVNWLAENSFRIAIAGRTCWGETEEIARTGYQALCATHGWPIDCTDPAQLVLFPEMDETADVPEITTQCWSILGKSPSDIMCASSRMVVKRKGADAPTVLPCTLIAYDERFEMGPTLSASLSANGGMFRDGSVKLNHPHCARFCVLGGASCSAK